MNKKCVIGVDLGGTNVRAGSFFEDGSEAGQSFSNPSFAHQGVQPVLEAIAKTVHQAIEACSAKPTCIGLTIPGHTDNETGLIKWAPNFGEEINGVFVSWKDVQVRDQLAKLVPLPIQMGNDANLAALGEYKFGCGKNSAKCLVMFTLGTGVGSGVVLNPSALQGSARGPLILVGGNKGAVELGHTVVNFQGPECSAGEYGSLESYISSEAIIQRIQLRLRRGRESVIPKLVEGDLAKISPRHLSEAADLGDEMAIEIFDEIGTMLGVGIANSINTFAPDIVAIGGQVAKAGDWLLKPAKKVARNIAIPSLYCDARIVIAEQIAEAGMMGAAALALEASTAE